MNDGEKKVFDFIKAMNESFGAIEFMAKGSIGAVVKTKNFIRTKHRFEIIPHIAKKLKA